MPDPLHKAFSLDVGIEQILRGGTTGTERLPADTASLRPSEDHPSIQLDDLYRDASMDRRLIEALKPDLKDPNILIPARYRAALDQVQKRLKELAEKRRSPDGRRALTAAASLLAEEKDLLDLLETYRNLLHQA